MPIDDLLHRLAGHYVAAPQWVKTVVGGVYAAVPMSVRFGARYPEFSRVFGHPPDPAWIAARLAATLRVALTSVPAYAGLRGLVADVDAKPYAVLTQMPVGSKEHIKAALQDHMATGVPASRQLKMFTGGSTSVPMTFFLEKGVTRAREWAAVNHLSKRLGVDGDGVVLALRGRTVRTAGADDGRMWMYEPIKRHLIVSTDHLEDRYMPGYVQALQQWRPKYIHAFPSALFPLMTWCQANGHADLLRSVQGLLLTSESVFPHHLQAFKAFFDAPVIVHYGHSERVLFGHTLAGDPRYHMWPHYGHMELLDSQGRPVTQAGQAGELVGTSFDNAVMPFVRYRTGDYAVLSAEPPAPGWEGFPVLDRIEGRVQEFVVTADHRLISITTIGAAHFDQLASCVRIQFEQHEPGQLVLRVVPIQPLTESAVRELQQAVLDKTQGGCSVRVESVASIPVTERGKQRLLLQHLPVERYLGAAGYAGAASSAPP